MHSISFTKEELEYLRTIITKQLDTYLGHESKVLENIKSKLDIIKNTDSYYDAVDY